VANCIYFGTTATNKKYITEEIKSRSDSGNTCCLSHHNTFCLLIYIIMHRTKYAKILFFFENKAGTEDNVST
jgi:hypothetical protein